MTGFGMNSDPTLEAAAARAELDRVRRLSVLVDEARRRGWELDLDGDWAPPWTLRRRGFRPARHTTLDGLHRAVYRLVGPGC